MLYKAFTWKLKEEAESLEEATEQLAAGSMEFEDFLDAGMIEKIEVFTKNELRVWFQDGKMKTMDCPGQGRAENKTAKRIKKNKTKSKE